MKKELKDYLHLYLGCECAVTGVSKNNNETFKLTGISYDDTQRIWWCYFEGTEFGHSILEDTWPTLRKLSDMAEDEKKELWHLDDHALRELGDGNGYALPYVFTWCLSKHFDLFGLIEAGIAIDRSTLNPTTNDTAQATPR